MLCAFDFSLFNHESYAKGQKLGAKIIYLHCLQEIIWFDNILLVFLNLVNYFCCRNFC